MKRNLLISFSLVVVSIIIMRWQGSSLITPLSPKGIIDLEFARTPERLNQLRLFWNTNVVANTIYIDFLFVLAYAWFLVTACRYINSKTGWGKWCNACSSLAITAALFDVFENLLMLFILNGRFKPELLEAVFWSAILKFVFAGAVVLFLLLAWPFSLRRKAR